MYVFFGDQYWFLSSTLILFSCRNDAGVLVRTERLRTKDITQKVKAKNYWQVRKINVCVVYSRSRDN
jgi:hypothetical protein